MRVIVTGSVTDYLGAFAVLGTGTKVQVVHGYENASLGRLQAVLDARQSAGNDDAHGVSKIGLLHGVFNEEIFDVLVLLNHIVFKPVLYWFCGSAKKKSAEKNCPVAGAS